MFKKHAQLSFLAATAAGLAGCIGQIIILREFLVLFYGNELSTGLVFASWLLWTGAGSLCTGRYGKRHVLKPAALPMCLTMLAVLLPGTLLWIRASRVIWSIPQGEIVPPSLMLAITLSSTSLFCLTSGSIFAIAWSLYASYSGKEGRGAVAVYLGEAAGAAIGGLVFYFVLLPRVSVLTSTFVVSVTLLICVAVMLQSKLVWAWRRAFLSKAFSPVFIILIIFFSLSPQLDSLSRSWQWGRSLLSVRDTPFHNLALIKNEKQFSFFANGLWLYSAPDLQSAEYAVHPALLQHAKPQSVLLIGGAASGLLGELLKHPDIKWIDVLEPDREVVRMADDFLSSMETAPLRDDRVHLVHSDPNLYLRSASRSYDVVILNVGDPLNAEMNRFYTVEFFRRVRGVLNAGGVFSFAVSSSPDIIGSAQALFLRSLHGTLRGSFEAVMVYPGESARFFASDLRENLIEDPQEMIRRIAERKLDLKYVREYYLFDYLNPMRLEYMAAVLREASPPVRINRDFEPTCYFKNLVVWSAQLHPRLEKTLHAVSNVPRPHLWAGICILMFALWGFFRTRLAGPRAAVGLCVLVVGGVQMILQVVIILAFQILQGFVYTQLSLIIACFMAGIAIGAALLHGIDEKNARKLFVLVQAVLALFLIGVSKLFVLLQRVIENNQHAGPVVALIFSILALISGVMGGLHFSLGVKTISGSDASPESVGAGLYAADLMGAAGGALIGSLFLLPVYGLDTTLVALSLLSFGTLGTLLPGKAISKG